MFEKKRIRLAACLLSVLFLLPAFAYAGYSGLPPLDIQAKSALLVYAPTGEILYEHNIHVRRDPASITKIMTTLLILEYAEKDTENGGLDAPVTALEEDFFDIQDGGSTANIQVGETLRLEDILYCIMISSANEACNVAARYVGGTVADFVVMMNDRAAALGCEGTNFANTHGLTDPNHYTTAYDIYLIIQECIKNEKFLQIAHMEAYTVPATEQTPQGRNLKTTNYLIASNKPDYIYPPARGIKTGSTQAAGHCLASLAEKNDMTLISVVLGASVEEDTKIVRSFTETRDLFEWGFNNFTTKRLIGRSTIVASTTVEKGVDADEVELVPSSALETLVPVGLNVEDIERKIELLYPDGIKAPVTRDQKMGTLTLSYQGNVYGTVDLLANKSIQLDTAEEVKEGFETVLEKDWVKYVIIGAAALVVLYIVLILIRNIRRRGGSHSSNYRGNRRRR